MSNCKNVCDYKHGNRWIMPFSAYTAFTPEIPKFYWDVKSQEQRILAICKALQKTMCYTEMLGDNFDKLKSGKSFYPTVEDMIQDETIIDGDIVATAGFYEVDDHGAAFYAINEDSSGVSDHNTIELCNGLFAHTLVMTDYTTPEQFGAYGNGATDDSIAFKLAIENGTCILSAKTYLVNQLDVSNCENVTIYGNDSTISMTDATRFITSDLDNLILNGIKFNGNFAAYGLISNTIVIQKVIMEYCEVVNFVAETTTLYSEHAVCLPVSYAYIDHCKINSNQEHGLIVFAREDYNNAEPVEIFITNCEAIGNYREVNGNKSGVGIGAYNDRIVGRIFISNCFAQENGDSGIAPHSCEYQKIDNCISIGNYEHGIVIEECLMGSITDCHAKDNHAYGIRVQANFNRPLAERHADNVTVSGNYILGNYGIAIGGGLFNVDVHGNTLQDVKRTIYLDWKDDRNLISDNVQIHDNTFNYLYDQIDISSSLYVQDVYDNIAIFNNYNKGLLIQDGMIRYAHKDCCILSFSTADLSICQYPTNVTKATLLSASPSHPVTIDGDSVSGTEGSVMQTRIPVTTGVPITIVVRAPKSLLRPYIRLWNSSNATINLPSGAVALLRLCNNSSLQEIGNMTITVIPIDPTIATVLLAWNFVRDEDLDNFTVHYAQGYKALMPY